MVLSTLVAVVFTLDAADVGLVGDAGVTNAGKADKSS
jgi:hypothetical protein